MRCLQIRRVSDFEILLFAYSVNEGEVAVIDLASGEEIPKYLEKAIKDDKIIKWTYNAQFERVCLSKYFGVTLNPISWRCTMVWSAYLITATSCWCFKGAGAKRGEDG